jgi:protein-disulfide isomerase
VSETRRPRVSAKYQPSRTSSRATYLLAGVAIVVIAVVVIGGIIWNSTRETGSADQTVLAENASLIIGKADAPHTIDVFEDFQCPYCKEFEASSGQAMVNAANAGKLRVRFHILNFLDANSGSGDYSSRAAGAALCVAQAGGADQFLKFHTKLFQQQPPEGGDSPDNAALASTAASVGASPQTQDCIRSGAQVAAAKVDADQSLTQLSKALGGRAGTPTVLSEGKPVANVLNGPGWLNTLLADNSSS